MSDTTITFRADEKIKQNFEQLCSEVGLNMSAAFNVFMRAAIREQGLPFDITAKKTYLQKKAVEDFINKINSIDDSLVESDFDELESGKYRLRLKSELDI